MRRGATQAILKLEGTQPVVRDELMREVRNGRSSPLLVGRTSIVAGFHLERGEKEVKSQGSSVRLGPVDSIGRMDVVNLLFKVVGKVVRRERGGRIKGGRVGEKEIPRVRGRSLKLKVIES